MTLTTIFTWMPLVNQVHQIYNVILTEDTQRQYNLFGLLNFFIKEDN